MSKALQRKLKSVRKKFGLTQNQLAERIGVPASTLIHWEQDVATPRGLALKALTDALNAMLAENTH